MEEALSSRALASIVEPSGAVTNTRQVINRELDFKVQDVTLVGSFELGDSVDVLDCTEGIHMQQGVVGSLTLSALVNGFTMLDQS